MTILTHETTTNLWKDLIKTAETSSDIHLHEVLESYLIDLLTKYLKQTHVVDQVMAIQYLEAFSMPASSHQKDHLLQKVGDECLLFAGLFPEIADKRHVNISYFVYMGRTAYHTVSVKAGDLFDLLAGQFVALMDVLQSIDPHRILSPLEAYAQWESLKSKRAFSMLETYKHHKAQKQGRFH